jgi:hypothetical protein
LGLFLSDMFMGWVWIEVVSRLTGRVLSIFVLCYFNAYIHVLL